MMLIIFGLLKKITEFKEKILKKVSLLFNVFVFFFFFIAVKPNWHHQTFP
jgi:hypothetical protein